MASTHKSLRSSTANKRPTTSIADGQIALNTNTTSPGLFFKDSTGATIIKVGPVHVGTTAPNASPAAGGSSGNSTGEVWLDTSLTPNGVKIWNGASWTNATPIGSTTVQGLLELATNAETQTGTDPDRAVTPAGLQSKVSDSTSTTSSTTIASSTAVKSAYDLANAALPKSGGTVTGNLEIGTTGSLSFEGATADAFETTIAVVDPTADRTITLPDTTGTIVTTGDTGTVTSTMIADGTIVDGDISASAEIAVSKLADGAARQLLQTDAAGTGVEWASNIDVPGTLDVTSTATFDSIASHPLGSAAAPTLTFTGDTNTGIYSPGADQVAISTGGSGRLFVGSAGDVGIGGSPSGSYKLEVKAGAIDSAALFDSTNAVGPHIRFSTSGTDRHYLGSAPGFTAGGTSSDFAIRTAGYLALLTGGNNERLRITSAGLVGVGTSSVTNSLHVVGTADTVARLAATSDANLTFSETTANKHWNIKPSGGDFYFQYSGTAYNSGYSSLLTIKNTGAVGIGTSSPTQRLTVGHSTTSDGIRLYNGVYTAGSRSRIGFNSLNGYQTDAVNAAIDAILISDVNTATELAFSTAGNNNLNSTGLTERLRIDSSGRVGIGSNSPQATLHTVGTGLFVASNSAIFDGTTGTYATWRYNGTAVGDIGTGNQAISGGANTDFAITSRSTGSLVFGTNTNERARIDSSGRLLVGTSSARGVGTSYSFPIENEGTGAAPAGISFVTNSNDAESSYLVLGKSRGTSIGANTIVQANDVIGRIAFAGADGTDLETRAAAIEAQIDGTPGANDMPGRLVFSTTADGASSPTERMRIRSNGEIQFGSGGGTNPSLGFYPDSAGGYFLKDTNSTNSRTHFYFLISGTTVGTITTSGSATAYNTSSDYRLKENVVPVADGITRLQQLKPSRFNFIADPDRTVDGFIAHEVQTVVPEAIHGTKDEVDADGNPIYQGIDQSKLVPLLTAALQEAVAKIESLEARLTAAGI